MLASASLVKGLDQNAGRQRDLFPLPQPVDSENLFGFIDWVDDVVLTSFFHAVVLALNALAGYGSSFGTRPMNQAQRSALTIVCGKEYRMCLRLSTTEPPPSDDDDALTAIVGGPGGAGSRSFPLVASACDVIDKSGTVDPLPFLPPDMIDTLCDAEIMSPAPPPGLECFKGPEGPHRQEYMKLMLRELLSGKTELRDSFRGGGTIFAVGKDGGRQRAVWDGSRVTQLAGKPAKPPHLASPAALQDVAVSSGSRLLMWKRDGKCLFD